MGLAILDVIVLLDVVLGLALPISLFLVAAVSAAHAVVVVFHTFFVHSPFETYSKDEYTWPYLADSIGGVQFAGTWIFIFATALNYLLLDRAVFFPAPDDPTLLEALIVLVYGVLLLSAAILIIASITISGLTEMHIKRRARQATS